MKAKFQSPGLQWEPQIKPEYIPLAQPTFLTFILHQILRHIGSSEFRDDAADQRLVYSVFGCFAQQGIHLALDLLSFLAVQPIVPIFDRIPGADHHVFTGTIQTP
jgi:hypothetical protein